MAEVHQGPPPVPESCDNPPQLLSAPSDDPHPPPPDPTPPQAPPPPRFDPSRRKLVYGEYPQPADSKCTVIGIIRRMALIKDLAAVYHAECLTHCQELLELQRKCEEAYISINVLDESKKETVRPPKRLKKSS